MDPVYGFEAVNVEAQSRSPSSLLNWIKRLIAARRSRRAFGRGTLRFLYPSNRKVIAYLRALDDEIILCVTNLSRSPQAVELDLSEFRGRQPVELLGRSAFPLVGELPYLLTLQPYSFFWFDLLPAAQDAAGLQAAPPEFLTLVMPRNWADLFRQHTLPQLQNEAVPAFLPRQRWFGEKDQRIKGASVRAHGEIVRQFEDGSGSETFLVAVVEAQLAAGSRPRYFLPLTAIWSPAETELRQGLVPITLAELRQSRKEGALVDALSQDGFALAIMDAIQREATVPLDGGEIRCRKTPGFNQSALPERFMVRRAGSEQSNSSVFFEEYGMLKLYRRLQPGPHPEVEMSRFLVERAEFANTPPLLATLEIALDGESGAEEHALGVLFGFIRNQGDGWTQALNYLTRYLDDALSTGEDPSNLADPDVFFLMLARQLGIRTAEMHRALAEHGGDHPDFTPEPLSPEDIAEWRDDLADAATQMLSRLERERPSLPTQTRDLADRVLTLRDALFERILRLIPDTIDARKTRYHGDFHLGQVLVVQNDFFIIDFEGEPARPLAARRRKGPPLRDVAGMIRSFDYAAVAAVRQLAEARPAAEPRMTQLAETWRQRAVDGFRAAYRKTMRGCAAYPASKKQAREMTAFFILEKAVYEVSYELANRPAWVDIPLKGILGILAKTERGEHAAPA
jgi:maltose alpha-D-glucosyltransferase/alpha-amylase